MLTVHHLRKSQSERVVFLCEELGLDYDLQAYDRDPATMAAPPAYKALHPLGAAPVITEGDLTLAESEAVIAYIIGRHGGGRLAIEAGHAAWPDYLYWFAFVNGTLQPALSRNSILRRSGLGADNAVLQGMEARAANMLRLVDARVTAVEWLAGDTFTAADIMMTFTLTTMRYFAPFDPAPYAGMKAYLGRIAARPAYQRAMAKGDPGMRLLLD